MHMRTQLEPYLPFFRKYWWRYLVGILALIVTDGLQLVQPRLIGLMADGLENRTMDMHAITRYGLIIVALAIGVAIFRYLWRIYIEGTARRLEYFVRDMLFRHLQTLPASFFNQHTTGDLMAYATNDVLAVRNAFGQGVLMLVDAGFVSTTSIILMATTVDWRLTVIGLLPMPLVAVMARYFGRVIHARFRKVQDAFSYMSGRAEENIAGIRVVKSFVQEDAQKALFRTANRDYADKFRHMVRVQALFWPLIQFTAGISTVIAVAYGGYLVVHGQITVGGFVTFNGYLSMLVWPMMAFGWVTNLVQRGMASLNRINEILWTKPEIADAQDALPAPAIRGEIEFRHLSFRYAPDLPLALDDINLTIRPGETLAILGRTGAGKSTLVNLIPRLYNPPRGQLFIDGVDVNHIRLADLRSQVAFVPQDSFLFSTTVARNIGFAPGEWSAADVQKAAEIARVHDDIADFPHQYDTAVGERGVTVSGGQRQRIGIARAVLKNAPILVLDDCLSAVDTQTEAEILANLRDVMKNRTSIVVSHRVSAAMLADKVIFLDRGRIVQEGTPEALVAQPGPFRDLWEAQKLEEEIALAE